MQIPEEDRITSLAGTGESELKIKGSRFLGLAAPAADRGEAGKIVLAGKKKYHAASHHCWAWRALDNPQSDFAFEDDGEPSGTAGAPILKALERANLSGAVIVVTRWFGGIKLGTGPLARAYSQAASEALEAAPRREGMLAREFSLTFDYPLLGAVNQLIGSNPAIVTSRFFTEKAGLNIAVSSCRAGNLIARLTEIAAGRIAIEDLGLRTVFNE